VLQRNLIPLDMSCLDWESQETLGGRCCWN